MKSGYEDLLPLLESIRQESQNTIDNPPSGPWGQGQVAFARLFIQLYDALDTGGLLSLVDDLY